MMFGIHWPIIFEPTKYTRKDSSYADDIYLKTPEKMN